MICVQESPLKQDALQEVWCQRIGVVQGRSAGRQYWCVQNSMQFEFCFKQKFTYQAIQRVDDGRWSSRQGLEGAPRRVTNLLRAATEASSQDGSSKRLVELVQGQKFVVA